MALEALMTTAAPAQPDKRTRPRRRTLYKGDPGMWSWVLHRITGATIFFFLVVHVLDTALVRVVLLLPLALRRSPEVQTLWRGHAPSTESGSSWSTSGPRARGTSARC